MGEVDVLGLGDVCSVYGHVWVVEPFTRFVESLHVPIVRYAKVNQASCLGFRFFRTQWIPVLKSVLH